MYRGAPALASLPAGKGNMLASLIHTGKLDIKPVKWIDQVFEVALQRMPEPADDVAPEETPAAEAKSEVKGVHAH